MFTLKDNKFDSGNLYYDFLTLLTKSEEDAFQWFKDLNNQYIELKKENKVSDEDLFELSELVIGLDSILEGEFISWLEYRYEDDDPENSFPTIMSDIMSFMPTHSKMQYEKYLTKLDSFEKGEVKSLSKAILNKKTRVELHGNIYDWDNDEEKDLYLKVDRNITEMSKYELFLFCANIIYNRGSLIARFYSSRGKFELAGITAQNGKGSWSCMSELEVEDCFEDGLCENEKVIILDKGQKPKNNKKINNVVEVNFRK